MSEPDAKTLALIDHVEQKSQRLQNGSKGDLHAMSESIAVQGHLLCAMARTPYVTPAELDDHIARCPGQQGGKWKSVAVICISLVAVVLPIVVKITFGE